MEQLLLGKIRGVAADAEIGLCAGEQRWSRVVSVAQSAWSLSKGLCALLSCLPEEKLWDVAMLAPQVL